MARTCHVNALRYLGHPTVTSGTRLEVSILPPIRMFSPQLLANDLRPNRSPFLPPSTLSTRRPSEIAPTTSPLRTAIYLRRRPLAPGPYTTANYTAVAVLFRVCGTTGSSSLVDSATTRRRNSGSGLGLWTTRTLGVVAPWHGQPVKSDTRWITILSQRRTPNPEEQCSLASTAPMFFSTSLPALPSC